MHTKGRISPGGGGGRGRQRGTSRGTWQCVVTLQEWSVHEAVFIVILLPPVMGGTVSRLDEWAGLGAYLRGLCGAAGDWGGGVLWCAGACVVRE